MRGFFVGGEPPSDTVDICKQQSKRLSLQQAVYTPATALFTLPKYLNK